MKILESYKYIAKSLFIEASQDDEDYVSIGWGKYKEKDSVDDPTAPTFKKDDSGAFVPAKGADKEKPSKEPKGDEEKPSDIAEIPYKEPNIAQREALEILETDRELGVERGLVVMATGLGKTFLAALDAQSFDPKRLLFVAHREEILKQSKKSFKKFQKDLNKKYP